MRPFTVSRTVDAPREALFDRLSDVSRWGEFCDHFMGDLRLERLDPRGEGAAVSFYFDVPLRKLWADLALTDLERPHRVLARGRMGRVGRVELECEYILSTVGHGLTQVDLRFETEVRKQIDRLRETGVRSWLKLQSRRSLVRLAAIAEGGLPTAHPVRAAAG